MSFPTVEDAAEALGLSRMRIRQLLAEGQLQGEKKSGIWIIDAVSLRNYRPVSADWKGRKKGNNHGGHG